MSSSNSPPNSRVAYAVAPERQDGELLDVGRQCSAVQQKCTVIDYLPFVCDHCKKRFCQDHRLPESHSCEKWDKDMVDRRALECPLCSELIAIPPGEDPNIKLGKHIDEDCVVMTGKAPKKSSTPTCSRARCGKPLWQPITCDKCRKQFCASHRYPKEHQCSSLSSSTPSPAPASSSSVSKNNHTPLSNLSSQTSAKSAAAMAALKRQFASAHLGSASSSSSSPTTQRQNQTAPGVTASTSGSSSTSNTSSKHKLPLNMSAKDRPELHASSLSVPVLPTVPMSVDDANANLPAPSITRSPSSPGGRCAPTSMFSFLDADAFVPPPLFGRA